MSNKAEVISNVSKSTGYPEKALKVLSAQKKLFDAEKSIEEYEKSLTLISHSALGKNSVNEFKLSFVAAVLAIPLEAVMKSALGCGAPLSKDSKGEYSVAGEGLIKLTNQLNGIKEEKEKPKMEEKKTETNVANGMNPPIEPDGEIVTEKKASIRAEKKVDAAPKEKKSASEPVKRKNGKASIKSIITGAPETSIPDARRFLVQSKLKKLDEVAYMTDAEVSKMVTKDYTFLYIGNEPGSMVRVAIPREELKKLDVSKIVAIDA